MTESTLRMFGYLSKQGTAMDETGLCSDCRESTAAQALVLGTADYSRRPSTPDVDQWDGNEELTDVTNNEAMRCQVCGRGSQPEDEDLDDAPTTRWFGESWGAPVCDPLYHIETPVGVKCGGGCRRTIEAGDQGLTIPHVSMQMTTERSPYHLNCFMSMIMGASWEDLRRGPIMSETPFKYNPRLASGPGEPLEVTVDLPDNATDEQHFEAMEEAARLMGFGHLLDVVGDRPQDMEP